MISSHHSSHAQRFGSTNHGFMQAHQLGERDDLPVPSFTEADPEPMPLRRFHTCDCHLMDEARRKYAFQQDDDTVEVVQGMSGRLSVKVFDRDGWEYFDTSLDASDLGEIVDIYERVLMEMDGELSKQTLSWHQADKNMFAPNNQRKPYT